MSQILHKHLHAAMSAGKEFDFGGTLCTHGVTVGLSSAIAELDIEDHIAVLLTTHPRLRLKTVAVTIDDEEK